MSSYLRGRFGDLFDLLTGRWVGVTDNNGNEQLLAGTGVSAPTAAGTGSAAANLKNLQASILIASLMTASSATVYVTAPAGANILYINPTLIIYSKVKLVVDPGLRIKLPSGVQGPMIVNANWQSTQARITSISDSAESPALTGQRVATLATDVAHNLVPGGNVMIRGDGNRIYNGIHEVQSVADSTHATFFVSRKTSEGAEGSGTNTWQYAFVVSGITTFPSAGDVYSFTNGSTVTMTVDSVVQLTGSTGYVLCFPPRNAAVAPSASGTLTRVQGAGDAGVTYGSVLANVYAFQVSNMSVWPAAGDTYTNNGVTFTVTSTVQYSAGAGLIYAGGNSQPISAGNLTRTAGAGDATIPFSGVYGGMTCEAADADIEITGGIWDYNADVNQGSYGTYNQYGSGLVAHAMVFNKVARLSIYDCRIVNVLKYAVFGINLDRPRIWNVDLDTASDGIHLAGSIWDAQVWNISGQSGDDFTVYEGGNTIDNQHSVINSDGTDSMSHGGDVLGYHVWNILPKRSSENCCAFYPSGPSAYEGIKFENYGSDEDPCNRNLYVGAICSSPYDKDIRSRDERGIGRSGSLQFFSVGGNAASKLTIDTLDLQGIYPNGAVPGSSAQGHVAFFYTKVRKLIIDPIAAVDMQCYSGGSAYFVQADNNSSFTDVEFGGAYNGLGTGSFSYVFNFNTATVGRVKSRPGYALSGNMGTVATTAIAGTPTWDLTAGCRLQTTARLWWGGAGMTGRVLVSNVRCETGFTGGSGAAPLQVYGTATVDLVVKGNDWGSSTYWLQIGNAAGDTPTVNLYHGGHSMTSGNGVAINWVATAPTVRMRTSDETVPIDPTKLTSIGTGCRFQNSNATYFGLSGAGQALYLFTVSGITTLPTAGATYTNNSITYTVLACTATKFVATGIGAPQASGTLTKASGTGDATVAFSALDGTGIYQQAANGAYRLAA